MKYIKNFACGFTLIEIMISLLISALLASALVPVIGIKKIKYPRRNFNHGIAECYYIPNGDGWKLKYYYESNAKNSPHIDTDIEGNSCTFTAPKAPYFEIIAIGAGGKSNGDYFEAATDDGQSTNGYLSVGSNFQRDISNAEISEPAGKYVNISQMIRDALNKWSQTSPGNVQALYTVTSPLGASGNTTCRPEPLYSSINDKINQFCNDACKNGFGSAGCDGPIGSFNSLTDAYKDHKVGCWAYIHSRGRSSAPGVQKTVSVPINGDSSVSVTQNVQRAGFSVKNLKNNSEQHFFYLNASPSGLTWNGSTNPRFSELCDSNVGGLCDDNSIYTYTDRNLAPTWGNENSVEVGCSPTVAPPVQGNVDFSEEAYEWEYTPIVFQIDYSTGGKPGQMKTMVFENLTGTLTLTPAKPATPDDESCDGETTVSKNDDVILYAESGAEGEYTYEDYNVISADLPLIPAVKNLARPKNREVFINYLSKLSSLNFNGGIGKNCADSMCPGFAGSGAYAYITRLDSDYKLTLTNNQLDNNPSYTLPGQAVEGNNASGCEGNDTLIDYEYDDNIKYCKPARTYGNPGAVIIIW